MTTLIDYREFEIESIPVKNVYMDPRVIRLFLTLYATETDTDPSYLVSPQVSSVATLKSHP